MKNFYKVIFNLLLIIAGLSTLFPLLWMISASLMKPGEASTVPLKLIPENFTLGNYEILFSRLNLFRYFLNSIIISISATFISLFFNSLAGYAFAKLQFNGRDKLFNFLLSLMIIPGQVTMLPLFLILKNLGLVNTYIGAIIPGMTSVFGIFMMRQFIITIPDSLIESAKIDGAGEFQIYLKIILPLCKPALVTLGLFTFIGIWNDFLWPLIIMTDNSMYTLPVAIANLMGEHAPDTELMMSGSVVTVLPTIFALTIAQRYYIQGIMAGSLKE
ncbi:MAG: carbohydrate ABC transporter permease [Candidatus Kryptonium sp.]